MDAQHRPSRTRFFSLLLSLCLPLLMGMRPCESVEGATPDVGQAVVEWGFVTLQFQQAQVNLALPQVVARLGITPRLEIGARGTYHMMLGPGLASVPWEGTFSAGNVGAFAKLVLLPGGLQYRGWSRPSVALLLGAEFLTPESLWGAEGRLAGSMWVGPVLVHLNIGFHYEAHPRVAVGAVVMVPLHFGLAPVLEVSGEVRYGAHPSAASILLGVVQALPLVPLELDLAVRRGLAAGSPDWAVLTGITLRMPLWHGT